MVNNSDWVSPQVAEVENSGGSVTLKEMGDRVAPNFAFWTNGAIGFSDAHLIIFKKAAVAGTELR